MTTSRTTYLLGLALALVTVLFLVAAALLVTAGVQAAVAIGAAVAVTAGSGDDAGASVVDVLGINAMFVALFAVAALLFRRSGSDLAPAQG